MPVLNTASPAALTGAPKLLPSTVVPSERVNVIGLTGESSRPTTSGRPERGDVGVAITRAKRKHEDGRLAVDLAPQLEVDHNLKSTDLRGGLGRGERKGGEVALKGCMY